MLSYAKLENKPRIFRSLSGLSLSEFEQLLPSFEPAWQDYVYNEYIARSERKRRYGGGRKPEFQDSWDKLLFILFYFFTVYYAAPPTEKATLKSLTIDLGPRGFFDTSDAPPGSSSSLFSVNSSSLRGISGSDIRADVTDGESELKVHLNSGTLGRGDSFAFEIDTDPSGTAPDSNFTTKEDFNGVKVRFVFDDGYSL